MPSRTLPEFVKYIKTQVAGLGSGSGKVPVVMGNEAGDLDSMASALVLAYFKSEHDGCAVFPVINVPRDELRLRKDNCEVFSVANISQEDLIFITEIPLKKLASDGRLQLTIVDHNELSPRQDFLAKSVVAILDHHKDAGLYKDTVGSDGRRNVQFPNGSATSLIADVLNKDDAGKGVLADPSANLLLQTTIMLDTDNLNNKAKTENLDKAGLTILKGAVTSDPWAPKYSARAEYFKKIKGLREDIEGFSAVDVIKKDLKYGSIGGEQFAIGSAPVSLTKIGIVESLDTLKGFASEMKKFIQANEIQSAFVLSNPGEGPYKQIVTATSAEEWGHIKESFGTTIASDKEYGGIALNGRRAAWPVEGVGEELAHEGFVYAIFEFSKAASRKQILPAVQDFFATHPRAKGGAMYPQHHHADDRDRGAKGGPKPIVKRKPKWGTVKGIRPDAKGINVMVKAVKCEPVVDEKSDVKVADAVCGDSTGCVTLLLRGEEQIRLATQAAASGGVLRVQNAKAVMVKGFIRVVVDKWAKLAARVDADPPCEGEVNSKNDISATEYELK